MAALKSTRTEEALDEVKEVLGVVDPVVVEVGVAREEGGKEVEEILGVDGAIAVPVGGRPGPARSED